MPMRLDATCGIHLTNPDELPALATKCPKRLGSCWKLAMIDTKIAMAGS